MCTYTTAKTLFSFENRHNNKLEHVVNDSESVDGQEKKHNKPKVIALFAGAGGLALGIEQAGFETLALIEIDKYASATLKKNRPEWRVI